MKFGKKFAHQMVQEWREAYMDYDYLKKVLKDILHFRRKTAPSPLGQDPKGSGLNRRLTLYRAFSGLTANSPKKGSPGKKDEQVIIMNAVRSAEDSEERYETMFLMSLEEGGDKELLFFKRLDHEFNKVIRFYREKVQGVKAEAEELNKQMDALIALHVRLDKPLKQSKGGPVKDSPSAASENNNDLVVIQELELNDDIRNKNNHPLRSGEKLTVEAPPEFKPASVEVLEHVKVNVEPDTPVSTLKNVFFACPNSSSKFSKDDLRKAEERLREAFVGFYHKLRLLKNYSFLNQLAFSKIMKKYDKITSRNASKSYLQMVDNSYLGTSDEVSKLIEKVEATFVKHFSNGNRRNGMNYLRPQAKRERHRVTFLSGLFTGCSVSLVAAIAVTVHARDLLKSEGRNQYMDNVYPLYSLFGFIILHMIMYAGNIYFWRRFRVNYPFIFGFKQGTELNYRQVLLLASGLSTLALAATLSNMDMEMDPGTKRFSTLRELLPLGLLIVVLAVVFCPLNIIYRSSRFFLIQCSWHCLCAPLYKVTLPDFFLADQFTSQVQAIRNLLYYACYYGWGNFKERSNKCQDSEIYKILYIIVAIIPFWARFLQCIRRLVEEKDYMHGMNGLKYFSTIVALVMRTVYDQRRGTTWRILAAACSGITTVCNTYWDVVIDWGLLRRKARYPWLRDRLLIPYQAVYFVAMVVNILLRLVWMQLVLEFRETSFLHGKVVIAIVAYLEILRRGIWNFFRLENEHLNNVGKYRAFKTVPLPFNYDEDKSV